MTSSLYECRVVHHRFAPRVHRFSYRIFMVAVDLDELGSLGRSIPILSVNRGNLFSLHEGDYLPTGEPVHNGAGAPSPAGPRLKDRVLDYLSQCGVDLAGGRVVLLTLPRVAGYQFNPVSFYFCYGADGLPRAAIAEVTNTFREMKPYLLGPNHLDPAGGGTFRLRTPKYFYVSPFSDVDVEFDFAIGAPGESLAVRIDDYSDGTRTLASALTGRRRPLTAPRLAWYTLKYPLVTLRVVLLIHLHALLLAAKRVPWFPKAARSGDQRGLYRPHGSIATTNTN
jgi:DUF1365 family protein